MHIVIVDPSRVVQRSITQTFQAWGFAVTSFSRSDTALDFILREAAVDIVLTSLELEPASGLELCWSLRTCLSSDRLVHVIVMSSSTSEWALAEALDSGADEFIAKPIRNEELRARLRAAERVLTLQRQLAIKANTDPLTGLFNRRAFFERMAECRQRLDICEPIAMAIFDIDHFKKVNDTFGHDAGDVVISGVGAVASSLAPIVARLGGEEFAMSCPGADADVGAKLGETVRVAIERRQFSHDGRMLGVTCSFGVSQWQGSEELADVLKRADLALYEAKRSGRNRVVCAPNAGLGEPAQAQTIRRRQVRDLVDAASGSS